MTAHTTEPPARLRISGPAELIRTIPYLLGFRPAESLVIVALRGRTLVLTAHLGMHEANDTTIAGTLNAARRGGATRVTAFVFSGMTPTVGQTLPRHELYSTTMASALALDLDLADAVYVSGGRYWSYVCADASCCPPEGNEVPVEVTQAEATMTMSGSAPLPSRADLAATLQQVNVIAAELVTSQLDERMQAMLSPTGAAGWDAEVKAAIVTAALDDNAAPLAEADVARFGAALTITAIRDAIWIALDEREFANRALWVDLARRLPGKVAAPAYFLAGWVAFRYGNGAEASMCVVQALDHDSTYSPANLLMAALTNGLDGTTMPKLRTMKEN